MEFMRSFQKFPARLLFFASISLRADLKRELFIDVARGNSAWTLQRIRIYGSFCKPYCATMYVMINKSTCNWKTISKETGKVTFIALIICIGWLCFAEIASNLYQSGWVTFLAIQSMERNYHYLCSDIEFEQNHGSSERSFFRINFMFRRISE